MSYIGMKPSKKQNNWKDPERAFIRDNYLTMTDEEMAEKLGRSEDATAHKRAAMGYFRQ